MSMHAGIDGPHLVCAFEQAWCRGRITLAGGLDAHHAWPTSLGGPAEPTDAAGLLLLCPIHHRRQHALIRAMVEAGSTDVHTVRHYAPVERRTAVYAVGQWLAAGKPVIGGWPSPAAVTA